MSRGFRAVSATFVTLVGLCLAVLPAHSVLDVENRGPQLTAGAFAMRITNIGAIGNPFRDVGRSFDPSLEYPRGSGRELLKHAQLWVGAEDPLGHVRVSGGPLLEWRPTLDPEDRVRVAYAGGPGTLRWIDDDGDGRIDEEFMDGRDDDADGEVDEDLGLFATQTLFARYRDDQPEATQYYYPNGESHVPLHLEVRQEAFAWAIPGYDQVVGLRFVITNRGTEPLTKVRIGLHADLDASLSGSVGGHLDDVARAVDYQQHFNDGTSRIPSAFLHPPISNPIPWYKDCLTTVSGAAPSIHESRREPGGGSVALVPLWHTTDPLSLLEEQGRVSGSILRPYYFAPPRVSFRSSYFANDLPPGQGGSPILDADRYRALAGEFPGVPDTLLAHDYVVLMSCGPFTRLDPGRSLEMDLALVVAPPESLRTEVEHALQIHHGGYVNALPDSAASLWRQWWIGNTGITGHEVCYEPPVGLEFVVDPHCVIKFAPDAVATVDSQAHYEHGSCVWTDLDCDACTGFDGRETFARWRDPAGVPMPPTWRTVSGDGVVRVEWDDRSEVLVDARIANDANVRFVGYNLYRLDDWRSRQADLPSPARFQQVASFARDTTLGARPLAQATDSSVAYDRILYERRLHPVGRYRWNDTRVLNGFDYVYAVTAVSERTLQVLGDTPITERLESPILATLDSVVTPDVAAREAPGGVWVVPNPFRARAPWDRAPVPGDSFSRHLDFMGLPRARSTIRIYTLAGDLVTTIDHDGSRGDGQARWDLISRNGQDVASGIYLFTVESRGTNQVGRFVVLR